MSNTFFQFKQFRINQAQAGMKVTTDACLFGAGVAAYIEKRQVEPAQLLDIGTGTGLLALMLAQATTSTEITAIEMNELSVSEAAGNFSTSPWKERLRVNRTSLQDFDSDAKYDLIICNPPFFGKNQKGRIRNKNQAVHNDHLSMEDLTHGIHRLLANDGEVWVLYPEWEMKAFIKWMEKSELFVNDLILIKNKVSAPVFRMIAKFTREKHDVQESELLIRNDDGGYSQNFSQLVKEYYL